MKKINLRKIILLVSLFGFFGFQACQQPKPAQETASIPEEIPLEDFFKNPETFQYRISPDGMYYSYMKPYMNRQNIHIRKVGSDEELRITSDTARDIPMHYWANNSQILYLQDKGGDENHHLFLASVDGSEVKDMTPYDGVKVNIINDLPDIEDEVIVGMNKNNPQLFDPYRLVLSTGELSQIAENPGNITGWMMDHDGKLRIAYTTDGTTTGILYRDSEEDDFTEMINTDFKESFYPMFFTFDNQRLYVASNLGRDKLAAIEYDPKSKAEIKELFVHDKYDINGVHYSRKRKVLTYIDYDSWKNEFHFLDKEYEKIANKIFKELNAEEISVLSSTKEEDKFIFVTSGDRAGVNYYIYDTNGDKIDLLAITRPWLKEDQLAEMKPVSYEARDGLLIEGYLTLPTGREAKNLPVVINPHGGPWARDNWGYNPEIQFLANRGYAVLQMNFRGSTGYGKEFWVKSFKEWGRKMQDDVSDGVQWLVDQGIADPNRIAIYGGSYGGYTTLAGLTITPEIYAAGIDYVGVSNLFTFMNTFPPYWEPYRQMMYEMVGNPANEEDSLRMVETSPALNAEKIVAPLLIAQGANDPRVKKAESDQMVEALKARGIDVEYIVKDNEGHGFSNEENRFEFYRAMESFLAKHLSDKPEAEKEESIQ